MKKLNYLFLMFLSVLFFACQDDTDAVLDNEAPNITIVSPTTQMEFYPDEIITVDANVRDNLGLESVSISVTPPGGAPQVVHTESVRDFLNDSKEADIEQVISLGTSTPPAGSYVITVQAVDKRDNDAEQSVTIIILEDDQNAPTVTITSPEANSSFNPGQEMDITASVEEDKVLEEIRVLVGASGADPIYSTTISGEDLDSEVGHEITDTITIPSNAAIGNYTLTIEAEDRKGNVSTQSSVPFTIVESTE